MKLFKHLSIAILLLAGAAATAQQLPQFTQYMYNTIAINPAYAGSRETLSIVGLHRSQWAGLQGAPETQTLSVHSPLRNENIGLGFSFINDQLGFENFSYMYADFSYTVQTGENTRLAFGAKAGVTHFNLDQELFAGSDPTIDPGDPVLAEIATRWSPNVGAGLYWHSNRWYLGLSAPRLLNTDNVNAQGDAQNDIAIERVSYYLTGGYVFDLSANTKLKPAFLVKTTNGASPSLDLTANFLFYEKFWAGVGYRINNNAASLGGIVDFQVSKQLRIGYAYEYPLSDIRFYTSGTHEFLLMFEVFKSKRVKSPRYF